LAPGTVTESPHAAVMPAEYGNNQVKPATIAPTSHPSLFELLQKINNKKRKKETIISTERT
jgi:hypothetical protein